jgi:hypothetical protein
VGAARGIARTYYTSATLRRLSKRCNDGAQVRRALTLSMVLEGRSRTEAAELNGMNWQILRDGVHRHNCAGIIGSL